MQARIRRARKAIERIDTGTDPDLPDDMQLRFYVRQRHLYTIDAATKVIADLNPDIKDFV